MDKKYQKMYEEFFKLRKNHKTTKENLSDELKKLQKDFNDFKTREPQIIDLNSNDSVHLISKTIIDAISSNKQPIVHTKTSSSNQTESEKVSTFNEPSATKSTDSFSKNLSELQPGQKVLVRWPDDGWYYYSVIKENLGNNKYKIEDSLTDIEIAKREDIISDRDNSNDSLQPGDTVIALHKEYEDSYAPGQVVKIGNDILRIKFYDFDEQAVPSEDVYKIHKKKFQSDVSEIVRLEKEWIGKTVVARNNMSHVYELGKIISQSGNIGRQYVIEWANGQQSLQNANHIFGPNTRKPNVIVNDYVIAPVETVFMPGRIIGRKGQQLKIKFVNGIE